MRNFIKSASGLCALILTSTAAVGANLSTEGCELGAYRSDLGEIVAISAPATGGTRYTFVDGRRGTLGDADATFTCSGANLLEKGDEPGRWMKIPLVLTPTQFASGGVVLKGLLIEPAGRADKVKPPLVVMAHGSESFGWLPGGQATPWLMAAQDVSTFIFDKRGTGGSGGSFHMNFRDLSDDLVAAAREARRLADGRYGRFGLQGGSQGGWTAPLAAKRAGADFLVVSFGGLFSPEEEDSEQVLDELRAAGHGDEILAKAREVTKATGDVVASEYKSGFEELARVKALYGAQPWFKTMRGEYTGDIVAAPIDELRGATNRNRIDWRHDSIAVMRQQVDMPTLWILAGEDREAPGRLTEDRLATLIDEGKKITVAVFPDTDHGMVEFTVAADGSRKVTRVTDGYYRLLADWMKGQVQPPYGRAAFSGHPLE